MATRKKKSSPPVTWLRRLRQRLTSRMACFVWGAIFGNAILSQPIQPLNLILEPPENMLSAASRQWLDALRAGIRSLSTTFTGTAVQVLREQATELIPAAAPPATSPTTATQGEFAACADQFPAQRPLQVSAISMQWAPLALCSDAFAVLYSGLTKTPWWWSKSSAVRACSRQLTLRAATSSTPTAAFRRHGAPH
nr:hypothetical protein [Comamonas jiangduensis]